MNYYICHWSIRTPRWTFFIIVAVIGAQQLDDINYSSKPSALPQRKPKPRPRPSLQHQLSHRGSTIPDSDASLRRSVKKSSSSTGSRALPPCPQRKPNYYRGILFLYTGQEVNIEKQKLLVLTTQYSEWSCIMGLWSMLHILNQHNKGFFHRVYLRHWWEIGELKIIFIGITILLLYIII